MQSTQNEITEGGFPELRKRSGIDFKRGDLIEVYTWSKPYESNSGGMKRHLMRDYRGDLTSVKGNKVFSQGYCWWVRAKFRFNFNEDRNVVVTCHKTKQIIYDTRESVYPGETE